MAGLDYITYLQALQTAGWISQNNTDSDFQRFIPRIIEYAELRIYRQFDFLMTKTAQTGSAVIVGNRNLAVPASVIVLEHLNMISPIATAPDSGTRNPVRRVSLEFLDFTYPVATVTGLPKFFAEIGTGVTATPYTLKLGPAPDLTYGTEFLGTIRPAPLSQDNPTTFISVNMPDLFVAASMVMVFGYQRDFGGQAADPQAAMSWEKLYSDLAQGLNIENLRQKAMSADWQTIMPSPAANTPLSRVSPQ